MRRLLPLVLTACTLSNHPVVPVTPPVATAPDLALLASPGPIELESVVSARWAVPLEGLVNLEHPAASGLEDAETPIVLPVHLLRHPGKGSFIVDTGVPRSMASGPGPVSGLVAAFLDGLTVEEPLGEILDRQPTPLAGVLITHAHLDHVLGLPDVPADVPVYLGPGELDVRGVENLALRSTYGNLLDGRPALSGWDLSQAVPLGPIGQALDVLGDGSLWALFVPGHTPGSMAYLARTTEGPVLFTGDTCHTRWGWENGVEPGDFTADHEANRQSLAALKALEKALPGLQVFVGHELDGQGTGVEAAQLAGR